MRVIDLLQPHLAGLTRVFDSSEGSLVLDRYLSSPELPAVRRIDLEQAEELTFGAGDLVLGVFGPDETLHGGTDTFVAALERSGSGTLVAVLFGYPLVELPYHLVLDLLVGQGYEVGHVDGLDYSHVHVGAVALRVDDMPGAPVAGDGKPSPASARIGPGQPRGYDRAAWLRLSGSYLFLDAVSRAEKASLRRILGPAAGTPPAVAERLVGVDRDRAALGRRVAELDAELAQLRRRLAEIESSTTMRLGRAFVRAAKRPSRAPAALPRDLARLWRSRGPGAARPEEPPSSILPEMVEARSRWLKHTATRLGPRALPVVAGVLANTTADALGPYTVLNRLEPEAGVLVLERTSPDLLVIDSAAARHGQPWAGAGDQAVPERDRQLVEIVDAARGAGVPVVMWWNDPPSRRPGLAQIAQRADLIVGGPDGVSWTCGVPLHRFNPIGADHEGGAIAIATDLPRAGTVRRALWAALASGSVPGLDLYADDAAFPSGSATARPTVRRLAAWAETSAYRAARVAVLLGDTAAGQLPARALHALACGAVVVLPGGAAPDAPAGITHTEPDAESVAKAVAELLEGAPPSAADQLETLRALALHWATPVQLAVLTNRLGVHPDPLVGRAVTVAAVLESAQELEALVHDLVTQRHPAAEVLVDLRALDDPETALGERGLEAVTRTGTSVVIIQPGRPGRAGDLAESARRATAGWVAPWRSGIAGPDWLLDLVAVAEASGADAVGTGGAELAPATWLSERGPLLVRAGRADEAGGDPSRWHHRGLRLVSLPEGSVR